MKHILAKRNRAVLEQLAQRRALLAFDFDGTLAPIVRSPARATMRRRTAGLLADAAPTFTCVLISGRARADVVKRILGVPFALVLGNHGAEWPLSRPTPALQQKLRTWLTDLDAQLCGIDGVVLEDKGHSIAVHYRRARNKSAVRRRIARVVARLRGARVAAGKDVFDVTPAGAAHKGRALADLWRALRPEGGLFLGDDATDEDAFRAAGKLRELVTIRIGWSRASQAAYYLRNQREVDELLTILLAARGDG